MNSNSEKTLATTSVAQKRSASNRLSQVFMHIHPSERNLNETESENKDANNNIITATQLSLLNNNNEIEISERRINLENVETLVYEKFSDINSQIQLKTEEKIAEIKTSNDHDINSEESVLPINLKNEIESIQNRSKDLIDYSDHCHNELKQKIIEIMQSKGNLLEQTSDFVLKNLNIEFVSNANNDSLLGYLKHRKDIKAHKINFIDFTEIIKNILPLNADLHCFENVKLRILEDGNYFITYKVKIVSFGSDLVIYDPIKKVNKHFKNLQSEKKVEEINAVKNKAIVMFSSGLEIDQKEMKIYNDHLSEIKSKMIPLDFNLVGANQSHIFLSKNEEIKFYNWSLQELERKIQFQFENEHERFYVPNVNNLDVKVFQFEQLQDFNIVRLNVKYKDNLNLHYLREPYVIIYDKNGNTIKRIKATGRFNIDLVKNQIIITYGPELLKYYDLKGDLLKEECLQKFDSTFKDGYYSIVYDSNIELSVFKSQNKIQRRLSAAILNNLF